MKTFMAKAETVQRKWYVVDAEGKTFGRLASKVATILRGKNKPIYTPHVDTGDFVIIVNAEKIEFTGKKLDQKMYRHHSQYPGGLKEISYRHMREQKPEFLLYQGIKGMLPHNSLGAQMIKKLKIYKGPDHMNEAQKPEPLDI